MRKIAIFLLIGALLVVTTGATGALHLSHDHHSDPAQDCQVCHIIKVAATVILLAALVLLFTRNEVPRIAPVLRLARPVRRTTIPVGLRAPPRR